MIDFASLQDRRTKLESLLKICCHAVDSAVVSAATEVSQEVLGTISRTLVSSLVTCSETNNGADHTVSPHVIIMLKANMDPAVHHSPPLLAARHATKNHRGNTTPTKSEPLLLMPSLPTNRRS